MQSVEEGKARLIVKRIVADLARYQSDPLSSEWESLNPATRDDWVARWTVIAEEVLGEEVEPPAWDKFLAKICNEQGYGVVMEMLAYYWQIDKGNEARTIGPHRDLLVGCDCEEGQSCEWCCGTHMLTHRVKRAMLEAEAKTETDEQVKPPLSEVQTFSMYSSWAEHFIRGMEGLGATKVSVPMSPNGSASVEFPKRSQDTIKPIDMNIETEERHDG